MGSTPVAPTLPPSSSSRRHEPLSPSGAGPTPRLTTHTSVVGGRGGRNLGSPTTTATSATSRSMMTPPGVMTTLSALRPAVVDVGGVGATTDLDVSVAVMVSGGVVVVFFLLLPLAMGVLGGGGRPLAAAVASAAAASALSCLRSAFPGARLGIVVVVIVVVVVASSSFSLSLWMIDSLWQDRDIKTIVEFLDAKKHSTPIG